MTATSTAPTTQVPVARREQLRTTLPIRRVVGPADVAALAVHLMTNTPLTGATFDIDGGQQLVER
jgi:NAD(P)-dependent dehydrogenase (short-subunit alcohol dehydrogenase family)